MKIALITDTHAGARNDSEHVQEHFINFFKEQFIPYIIDNKIDKIIHLGDVFDKRKNVNFKTLDFWKKEVFEVLHKNNILMDILVGNHDIYFKNTNRTNSPELLLSDFPNLTIHTNPIELTYDELDILCVPWINEENYESTLDLINNTKSELCFGHFEIQGFQFLRGQVNKDHGLKPSVFDKFYMTLSGHFHHRQDDKRIYYLGSPYEMTWADCDDSRGFHIFDTETRELTFIENTDKLFYRFYYDDKDLGKEILDTDFSFIKNKYVKLIVTHKQDYDLFENFIQLIYDNNPIEVGIDDIELMEYNSEDFVNKNLSNIDIISEYIKNTDLSRKDELNVLFKELYVEALSKK